MTDTRDIFFLLLFPKLAPGCISTAVLRHINSGKNICCKYQPSRGKRDEIASNETRGCAAYYSDIASYDEANEHFP